MDLKTRKLCNLPKFYQGVFTVWGMFQKLRTSSDSLFWLLKEPVLYGTRFNIELLAGPFMAQRFISAGVVTLKHVFDMTGRNLSNTEKLASHIGVRSIRTVNHLLNSLKGELTQTEISLCNEYCNGHCQPDSNDIFPSLILAPDFKNCTGPMLELTETLTNNVVTMTGKSMYKSLVKILNKDKLNGRVDTPWRAHFGLDDEVKPEWRTLYKPPLTKKVGDLQWRVLHGIVAVNAFISVINSNVNPFCLQRETVYHCFSECSRLCNFFTLLQQVFTMFGEVFTKEMFILGYRYSQKYRQKCQLFNFVLGQAKMAIYISRRNKVDGSLDCDASTLFVRMMKARLKVDFDFYSSINNIEEFIFIWCYKDVLCSVVDNMWYCGMGLS